MSSGPEGVTPSPCGSRSAVHYSRGAEYRRIDLEPYQSGTISLVRTHLSAGHSCIAIATRSGARAGVASFRPVLRFDIVARARCVVSAGGPLAQLCVAFSVRGKFHRS